MHFNGCSNKCLPIIVVIHLPNKITHFLGYPKYGQCTKKHDKQSLSEKGNPGFYGFIQ
jgi:hypothetical protein